MFRSLADRTFQLRAELLAAARRDRPPPEGKLGEHRADPRWTTSFDRWVAFNARCAAKGVPSDWEILAQLRKRICSSPHDLAS